MGEPAVPHIASRLAQEWRDAHPGLARTHRPVLGQSDRLEDWCILRIEPIPGVPDARGVTILRSWADRAADAVPPRPATPSRPVIEFDPRFVRACQEFNRKLGQIVADYARNLEAALQQARRRG